MDKAYPKHIYDPIRVELACSYITHELKKYLPSIKSEAEWEKITQDVCTWFDKAPYLYPVRDFWNGFHGILMGFKLYNHLLSFVTGENVIWTKESINMDELTLGSPNPLIINAGVSSREVKDIKQFYANNPQLAELHTKAIEKYKTNTGKREADRIIVTLKEIESKDCLVVYDGNFRTFQAILRGDIEIEAFVSRFTDKRRELYNFWLPTSELMDITAYAKKAWENKEEEIYQAYVKVIRNMLSRSESGIYEMKNRVLPNQSQFRDQWFKDLALDKQG